MKLYIADAFTKQRFSGNQAGVVLLEDGEDFPPDAEMLALAGELKHSETAFMARAGENRFCIRYFTPKAEVGLCGHATIAAFTAAREAGLAAAGSYRLSTRSGELEVTLESGMVWMDMAPPVLLREFDAQETRGLLAAYGLTENDLHPALKPQAVSTGLPDIMLPVKDNEALCRAVQNEAEVSRLSEAYGVVGVHMFCPAAEEGITARCRNFAPLYAIPEEAATGTSNGALTFYLYKNGLLPPGDEYRFRQGESMGKPSDIFTRLTKTADGVKIRVGGTAVITLKLEIL